MLLGGLGEVWEAFGFSFSLIFELIFANIIFHQEPLKTQAQEQNVRKANVFVFSVSHHDISMTPGLEPIRLVLEKLFCYQMMENRRNAMEN